MSEHMPSDRWIDPDKIAEEMRIERGLSRVTEDLSVLAFLEARNRRVDYAVQLQDFGFETVFSHGSNLAFLRALKAIGYEVHLYFVGTEYADINADRVRERVKLGGHSVIEHKIRSRYSRALNLLSLAVRDFDRVVLYDNSKLALDLTDPQYGGRVVCDFRGDNGGSAAEQIEVLPPIPGWAIRFGLLPFSWLWQTSPSFREITMQFGEDVHYIGRPDGDRASFLGQFYSFEIDTRCVVRSAEARRRPAPIRIKSARNYGDTLPITVRVHRLRRTAARCRGPRLPSCRRRLTHRTMA
jgi:predicted ABC-type ATPase